MQTEVLVALIAAFAALVAGPAAAGYAHHLGKTAREEEAAANDRQFRATLNAERVKLEKELWERVRGELRRAYARIETLEAEIGRLTSELAQERARNADLIRENVTLMSRLEALERRFNAGDTGPLSTPDA